jgi:hypothetical protein
MINLNTDQIQGFGETQAVRCRGSFGGRELVYQTSYRLGIHGEIYSLAQSGPGYGLIERVDQFPYNEANGEPVPDPPWAGPDGKYGTVDDQADDGVWE